MHFNNNHLKISLAENWKWTCQLSLLGCCFLKISQLITRFSMSQCLFTLNPILAPSSAPPPGLVHTPSHPPKHFTTRSLPSPISNISNTHTTHTRTHTLTLVLSGQRNRGYFPRERNPAQRDLPIGCLPGEIYMFKGDGVSIISLSLQDLGLGDLFVTSPARGGCCHFKNLLKEEPVWLPITLGGGRQLPFSLAPGSFWMAEQILFKETVHEIETRRLRLELRKGTIP